MNGFGPEEVTRGGGEAAAVPAVVANAAAAVEVLPPPPPLPQPPAGLGAASSAAAATAAGSAGPPGAAGPGAGQLCCLREEGERCSRAAGNASFSKRIQKSISQKKVKIELDKSLDIESKETLPVYTIYSLKLEITTYALLTPKQLNPMHVGLEANPIASNGIYSQARHLYICDFHKNLIQSVRNRRKRKGSDDDGDSPVQDVDTPEVDLFQLQVNTLRRYKRHFKLQTKPGLNKAQLVEPIPALKIHLPDPDLHCGQPAAGSPQQKVYMGKGTLVSLLGKIIGCHFRTIPVNEKDTLTYFIYSVKNDKNKSDLKMDSGVH